MPPMDDGYDRVVAALKAMMAAPRDDREHLYREAADRIVEMRHQCGGVRNGDYRAAIQQAYREAGVPSDSEDTVLAALRYHIGKAGAKTSPKGPVKVRKAATSTDGQTMPGILSRALEDPVGLVRHAIRAVQAAGELKPRGPDGETVRYMLSALREAVDNLAAVVDQNHDAG
jgi:hypothetical protein